MSTLAAALAWAARGFRVFPLAAGTKDEPLVSHVDEGTSDPARIRQWWVDPLLGAERDYNVGVVTTGFDLIDIDVRAGKPGLSNFLELGGHFDTLTVRTPSGGFHCYYKGPDAANRVGILGKDSGLDIRSFHGYALAPGSSTAEGAYSLEVDVVLADIPLGLRAHLRPPMVRPEGAVTELVETPAMVERALAYLLSCRPAIEGQGGDGATFETAARLRDFGIPEATAARLMIETFNPRCLPPWPPEELKAKVANAYAYGTAQFGILAPELHYGGVSIPAEPAPEPIDTGRIFRFGNAVSPIDIAPRPWIMKRLLMRRQVTMLVGAGATGKSTQALQIAAHLAMGRSYAGYPVKDGTPMRSVVYNEEDDVEEQSRRLWAICAHFKFDFPTVRERIALVSREEISLSLVVGDRPAKLNAEHVKALIEAAIAPDIGLIAVGPLVSIHQAIEEDNVAMTYVMGTLRLIAEKADVAMLVDHHVGKSSSKGLGSDMYAARGAGSIVNVARIGLNLVTPTADEATNLGIEKHEAHMFVAMGDAKMNLALASGSLHWFKKTSIHLPNGDEVGVLDPYDMIAKGMTVASADAETIAAGMRNAGVASCTVADAAIYLKGGDLLRSQMTLTKLRPLIMSAIATPVETSMGKLKLERSIVGGRDETLVVLE